MTYDHVEKATFSFPCHRDVDIGLKNRVIFATSLLCCESATKARHHCHVAKMVQLTAKVLLCFATWVICFPAGVEVMLFLSHGRYVAR